MDSRLTTSSIFITKSMVLEVLKLFCFKNCIGLFKNDTHLSTRISKFVLISVWFGLVILKRIKIYLLKILNNYSFTFIAQK